ncbi:hypothetical protein SAMN02982929_06628 [Saccharopolyspora kobensis]|uniref:Uncharacterized protein n=1 Tax=Saccharopolyspora kobensis TaxID=146035 RepID=A0A1H6EJX8_9PSEU|nr:hypothetical protein [Saccharopolyspora kobensis]SEG97054.1 hypothetical protein SAMN02982929_06628 [Saccharopolyspora kobensis]SFE65916.1 hypothetical protein SAMN05216506_11384 [Saccharopolyspora kobensis]
MRGFTAVLLGACLVTAACGGGSESAAQQVVDQFVRDGLPVPHPRDNSERSCPQLGCAQLITTDVVSVLSFADESAATRFAARFGPDAFSRGPIVLQYAAARTPEDRRAQFESSLEALLE